MTRVFFYVQHLQGIGHVVRSSRIAQALAAHDFEVKLVLGGMPIPELGATRERSGITTYQLPPLKAGPESFRDLLDANGAAADAAYKAGRTKFLLEIFDRSDADVVVIEAFPFDRPQMHFELIPLLERARARLHPPAVVSSVRDILQIKPKAERDATARDILLEYFDAVLVHGDPRLATLDETFRHAHEIEHLITYTGIVAPDAPNVRPATLYDAIISTGGGATDGYRVLEAAMHAKSLSPLASGAWLALVGPFVETARMRSLTALATSTGVTLSSFVDNLPALLMEARVSISQAGSNTVADILRTGCRAVLCPYSGIRQNEQTQRAARLSEHGCAVVVDQTELSGPRLAQAVADALEMAQPSIALNLEGATGTAVALRRMLEKAQ